MKQTRPTMRFLSVLAAAALLRANGESTAVGAERNPLRVRASEAFGPCLVPALEAFSAESGLPTMLDLNEPDPPGEADVVVGDDSELTRVLEGGAADLASAFDLGYLPWVYVVPEASPAQPLSALGASRRLLVLGGRAGRRAREAVALPADRVSVSTDRDALRQAEYALVPRSLAGPGELRPAGVRPLVATVAAVRDAAHPAATRQFLAFLRSTRGRAVVSSCLVDAKAAGVSDAFAAQAKGPLAASVVDWWLCDCSLHHNAYNDPLQVLGAPDAVYLGAKELYQGFMSLGQGGFVTVDMGASAVDGPGPDIRVYQTTSGEPVTLYAATSPEGPFTPVGLQKDCGQRTPGINSNHCDFDLHDAGLLEARYFKIEDGEIYPCLAGGTVTEGADIDAVQILNAKP